MHLVIYVRIRLYAHTHTQTAHVSWGRVLGSSSLFAGGSLWRAVWLGASFPALQSSAWPVFLLYESVYPIAVQWVQRSSQ